MKIGIVGPGGSGKGTSSHYLATKYGFKYSLSTSEYMAEVVFKEMQKSGFNYLTAIDCWRDRRNHREFWFKVIDAYDRGDGSRVVREIMQTQDILDGLRRKRDLEASRDLCDFWVYIDRPGYSEEATNEITPEMCDYTVKNDGTVADLYDRLDDLIVSLGRPLKEPVNATGIQDLSLA